jgi:hypothetical protein
MAQIAYDTMPTHGRNASRFWNAFMSAVVQHLQSATKLITTDPDVGTGTGKIIIGSFGVTIDGLRASIDSALEQAGARGRNRPNFSLCAATGIVENMQAVGTGTVDITGNSIPLGTSGIGNGVMS